MGASNISVPKCGIGGYGGLKLIYWFCGLGFFCHHLNIFPIFAST